MRITDLSLFEEIDINGKPQTQNFRIKVIYVIGLDSQNHWWHIGFDGVDVISQWGIVDGEPQEARRKVVLMSQKTLVEQALLNMRHDYAIKYRKEGYRPGGDTTP